MTPNHLTRCEFWPQYSCDELCSIWATSGLRLRNLSLYRSFRKILETNFGIRSHLGTRKNSSEKVKWMKFKFRKIGIYLENFIHYVENVERSSKWRVFSKFITRKQISSGTSSLFNLMKDLVSAICELLQNLINISVILCNRGNETTKNGQMCSSFIVGLKFAICSVRSREHKNLGAFFLAS